MVGVIAILSTICILLVIYTLTIRRSYRKFKESKKIQFSDILDSNGEHGMARLTDPSVSYMNDKAFYVEFKVISRAMSKDSIEYLNIRVLNVLPINSYDSSDSNGDEILEKIQWLRADYNEIYWFTDNDSRKRDSVLTEILND